MRLFSAVLALVAAACARQTADATWVQPSDLTVESLRAPRDQGTNQISGLVKGREGSAVMLDSGGPRPIALRIGDSAKVIIDEQPGSGAQLREGDLVRAAYRFDNAGEAQALQVVANTRPVETARIRQPAAARSAAAPPAAGAAQPATPGQGSPPR